MIELEVKGLRAFCKYPVNLSKQTILIALENNSASFSRYEKQTKLSNVSLSSCNCNFSVLSQNDVSIFKLKIVNDLQRCDISNFQSNICHTLSGPLKLQKLLGSLLNEKKGDISNAALLIMVCCLL